MARKKQEEEPCGNWMDTYGDMVTLLLTFFVMLYSMSTVDEEKFAILVKAFTSREPDVVNVILDQKGKEDDKEFPLNRGDKPATSKNLANATLEELQNAVPDSFDELYEYLRAYVEKSNMSGSVQVSREGDGCVFIRFQDNIFFNPDSSNLRAESRPMLEFLGNCLVGVEDEIRTVNINGHTADPGIENYGVSDWRLSSERAANVAIYLEEQKGMDPKKLLPIGYGKNFPIAENSTPEGQQRNRRVDMIIISVDSDVSAEALLSSILEGTFDTDRYPGFGGISDILTPPALDSSSGASASESPPPPAGESEPGGQEIPFPSSAQEPPPPASGAESSGTGASGSGPSVILPPE